MAAVEAKGLRLSPLAEFAKDATSIWDGRFSKDVLLRADKVAHTSKVKYLGKEDGVFSFSVQGNREEPYRVEILLWGKEYFMHCTCMNGRRLGPRGECYHLAAVCLRIYGRALVAIRQREKGMR